MPTYQIAEVLARVGLALAAGVLIGTVPIARRAARYEPRMPKRIFFNLLSLGALIGFCFYVVYLWNRFIPREPEGPAPIEYPATPVPPEGP